MRTSIITLALLLAASLQASTTITFSEPIEVTAVIPSVELEPIQYDYQSGIYMVTATHTRSASEITTNGVTVAVRSQVHVTVAVRPDEQVAWLQANGMPEITAEAYPNTPIAPTLKTQMITAIAMAKALPAISAALEKE